MTTEKLKIGYLQRKCTVHLWRLSRRTVKSWTTRQPTNTGERKGNAKLQPNPEPIYCELCGQRFSSLLKIKNHKNLSHTHHSNWSKNKCQTCEHLSPKMYYRNRISDRNTIYKRYQCPSCGKLILKNKRILNGNGHEIPVKELLKCSDCGDTPISAPFRKSKKILPTSERPFKCSMCDKSFTLFCYKRIHIKNSHSKIRPFKCSLCDSSFTTATRLKYHERIHRGDKRFSCSICNSRFYNLTKLNDHFGRLHAKEKHFFCSMCKSTFYSLPELTIHLRSHTGERPFKCSMCSKGFTCRSNLNRHVKIHAGKTYKCDLCQCAFSTGPELRRHVQRRHKQIKTHFCSMCDKSYYSVRDLSQHIRVNHTREKPFKCNICGKDFSTSPGHKQHMSMHTGVYLRFKCPKCSKKYPYKASLRRHMKIHKWN